MTTMTTKRINLEVQRALDYIQSLEETIDDLHANIGGVEWAQLDEDTQAMCQYVHTLRLHPEIPL